VHTRGREGRTAKILKDVLERVEGWPEEAQTELARIASKLMPD
jgi:hypothetical protein